MPFGRAEINRLLAELDAELVKRGARADLFLVGGAALALAYDARRRPVTLTQRFIRLTS
jgi:hypothetical protein